MSPTTLASTFRAKTNAMKTWRPRNPPSNRDRLELYALHKQSVSGDAPPVTTVEEESSSSSLSVADKAKLAAWRTKRGMVQADAMQRYVEECKLFFIVVLLAPILFFYHSFGEKKLKCAGELLPYLPIVQLTNAPCVFCSGLLFVSCFDKSMKNSLIF
jgi:acyl-CoA-binding protein